jgi:hypothetical protein
MLQVVGDRFSAFARVIGAYTYSQLLAAVDQGHLDTRSGPISVSPGQGVEPDHIQHLRDQLVRRGFSQSYVSVITRIQPVPAKCEETFTSEENSVLIANLTRESSSTFTATLRLHNDNPILQEMSQAPHVTSTAVIEASRQILLAATIRHYSEHRRYPVISAMETKFESYLFPLPARLLLTMEQSYCEGPPPHYFQASIAIEQGGRTTSVTRARLVMLEWSTASQKETEQAAKAFAVTREN